MISSATFHVITTELVVGSFAMAGVCFLLKAIQSFNFLTSEKISQVSDIVGHFALGFGLIATPFAIFSGISSSPGSDVSSPLLVNKIFLSMIATGLAVAAIYARYSIGEQIWASKSSSITQSSTGLAASGFMLLTASAGGKFTRNESLFDLNTNLSEIRVSDEIRSSLLIYEPRIDNIDVSVTIAPDSNEMNCTIQYDITGIPSPTQEVDVLLFPARV